MGGTNPPFPRNGYSGAKWGEIIGIGANHTFIGVDRSELQNKWDAEAKFSRCEDKDWCDSNFRCNEDVYRRRNRLMCWTIAKGHVSFFDKSWRCPGGVFARWAMTIFLFVLAIIVFVFLNVIMGQYQGMDIFLNNTRNMSIVKDFKLSWPLDSKFLFSLSYWFTFLDISQIDAAIVEPTCVSHSSFMLQAWLQISLYILLTLFYFGSAFTCCRPKVRDNASAFHYSKAIQSTLSMTTMMCLPESLPLIPRPFVR